MIRVYIASPYTQGDKSENLRNHFAAGNELLKLGFNPFMPLLSHFFDLVYPQDYDTYINVDLDTLERCDALLRLPGFSPGAEKEEAFARKCFIPIFYNIGDLADYFNKTNKSKNYFKENAKHF